jgi:hypothetical protein
MIPYCWFKPAGPSKPRTNTPDAPKQRFHGRGDGSTQQLQSCQGALVDYWLAKAWRRSPKPCWCAPAACRIETLFRGLWVNALGSTLTFFLFCMKHFLHAMPWSLPFASTTEMSASRGGHYCCDWPPCASSTDPCHHVNDLM